MQITSQSIHTREETDSLGTVCIPNQKLYGSNTARALENFPVNDRVLGQEPSLVRSIGQIKKACALANMKLGNLEPTVGSALVKACDEMMSGALDRHLVVPILEGSGGTSTNMNANEVLANRALLLMNHKPGNYARVHPNDHVNCCQSTNDVIPSALKLATFSLVEDARRSLGILGGALTEKITEFASVYRLGRTCLQDAQPMTLGQAFEGYSAVIYRALDKITRQQQDLLSLPLGGTAIGTGLGSNPGFQAEAFKQLENITGLPVTPSKNRFDGMQNMDELQRLSAELETVAGAMAKIARDFIILSSGPSGGLAEITLPAVQPGSSIMPGKVNPVIPMSVVQLSHIVHGNHCCITMACQDGMLEINHYEHSLASRLFDSLHRLDEIAESFANRCVKGIKANTLRSMENLQKSYALATTLVPKLGYSEVSKLVKDSVRSERPFLEIAQERNLISESEILELIQASVKIN
ncbi:MAG: aspartate ammonia-lyase [Gammaproteobacteria bacterium]|nr:aspartate ammonia-lyase [Gammaproteobacteria bacterium]